MKKFCFILGFLFITTFTYGQIQTYKAAKSFLNKKDYISALELALKAASHPDTKDNADVYVILGQGFMYLFKKDLSNISLAQESFNHFQTAIKIGGYKIKEKLMEDVIVNSENERLGGGEGLMYLQSMVNMQANLHFEAQDYNKSYEYFLIASNIVPDDIVMNFYVGYCAYVADKDDAALEKYQKVIELNNALPQDQKFANTQFAYNGLIDIYFTRRIDYDKALKYIKMAKEAYPEEKLYKDYEIDVLIKSEKMEEAIQGLKDVESSGNATKNTYYMMAFLYRNNENFEEALQAANLALRIDAEYYDALYVAGSVHFNQGVELFKAANNTDDESEYLKLKKDAIAKFSNAMPYFEKAVLQRPEDIYSLNPLSTIYDQLDMDAKRDEILDRIEKLDGN